MKNHLKQAIIESKDIAITGHINPDGDCIGSILALGIGLINIGKRVHLVLQDSVPKRYKNLPYAYRIKKRLSKIPDMAIAVDCNTKEMIGKPFDVIKKAKYILEIDHHEYRRPFGNLFLIDINASAVGELVYKLLKKMKISITKDIARNILTSIIVETNSFRLPVVRPLTFGICESLLKTGVDFYKLSELIYWSKTKETAILSGICMSKLKFFKKEKIAWSIITKKEFSKIRGKDEDVDSVANDILSIKTVRVAIIFREKTRKLLRVSLRSKGRINVAFLASSYGGGGHFDSSGCYIDNKKNSIKEFLHSAKQLIK